MSEIYEALEKAARQREKEKELVQDLPSADERLEIPETQEIRVDPEGAKQAVISRQLIAFSQPGSLAAEQFRKLRAQLLKFKHADSPKTIMVTSAMNGEGKTFVAANLAAGIANDLQTRALLVDSDLRNPSLSQWFDFPVSAGLSDYLLGKGVPQNYIFKTGLEKLSLLPAGTLQENPTELIGPKKMETLIRELKSLGSNRYIIFDSTPILATTEPETLGRLVDGIILVVRAGVTPREAIQQAFRSLEKEKIIGLVLNDLTFKSPTLHARYFGANGYYYRYGYGRKGPADSKKWWQKLLGKKGSKGLNAG